MVLMALLPGHVQQLLPARFQAYLSTTLKPEAAGLSTTSDELPLTCESHKYTSEIVSLDPLVIYINNFTSYEEAEQLIKVG